MQKLIKILIGLIIAALAVAGIFLYSIYYRVEHVKINHRNLYSEKIPESMNDVTIGILSDIRYNEFMNEKRLSNMLHSYKSSSADVCVFAGDLFSERLLKEISEEDIETLTALLKEIEAPLGKFAILGDSDLISEERMKMVKKILTDADFELISSHMIQIRSSKDSDSISLIGIDSYLNHELSLDGLAAKLGNDNYHLLVTHCPDFVNQGLIDLQYFDAIASGHSLGGQIYMPLIGTLLHQEGAQQYYHGSHSIGNTMLYICNGLGTINIDMRLFAPPEILILQLHNK